MATEGSEEACRSFILGLRMGLAGKATVVGEVFFTARSFMGAFIIFRVGERPRPLSFGGATGPGPLAAAGLLSLTRAG